MSLYAVCYSIDELIVRVRMVMVPGSINCGVSIGEVDTEDDADPDAAILL